jgi:hypothetical protein
MASSDDQEQQLSEAAGESLKPARDLQGNPQTQDEDKFYCREVTPKNEETRSRGR